MDISELVNGIKKTAGQMIAGDVGFAKSFQKLIPHLTVIYEAYIELIPALNEIGMDIDSQKVIGQIREVTDNISDMDKIRMFDLLYYEIPDTLLVYDEIRSIMNEEQ